MNSQLDEEPVAQQNIRNLRVHDDNLRVITPGTGSPREAGRGRSLESVELLRSASGGDSIFAGETTETVTIDSPPVSVASANDPPPDPADDPPPDPANGPPQDPPNGPPPHPANGPPPHPLGLHDVTGLRVRVLLCVHIQIVRPTQDVECSEFFHPSVENIHPSVEHIHIHLPQEGPAEGLDPSEGLEYVHLHVLQRPRDPNEATAVMVIVHLHNLPSEPRITRLGIRVQIVLSCMAHMRIAAGENWYASCRIQFRFGVVIHQPAAHHQEIQFTYDVYHTQRGPSEFPEFPEPVLPPALTAEAFNCYVNSPLWIFLGAVHFLHEDRNVPPSRTPAPALIQTRLVRRLELPTASGTSTAT